MWITMPEGTAFQEEKKANVEVLRWSSGWHATGTVGRSLFQKVPRRRVTGDEVRNSESSIGHPSTGNHEINKMKGEKHYESIRDQKTQQTFPIKTLRYK